MNRPPRRIGMPLLHSRLIERPRLREKLSAWRRHRIITITAPAGFGKSTCVAMWLHAEGIDAAWLTLDAQLDDPHAFIAGLVEAMRLPRSLTLNLHAAALAGQMPPSALLRMLLDVLDRHSTPRILVIDDAHLASNCTNLLQNLIDAAPPTLHLIFASRSRLPMHIPSESLHLDADDLRFDHAEFDAFVERTRLSDFSPDQLRRIERRADGWIIALQLISISTSASNVLDGVFTAIHSSETPTSKSDFLLEYLDQHVLRGLNERLRSFLMHAALPPEFDAPLAAALAEVSTTESQQLLKAALDADLLLTMQPAPRPRHGIFRFHPLFREFLVHELHIHSGPNNIRRLQRITASYFEAQDQVEYALDFFLLADDAEEALRLVRTRGRRALYDYEFAKLRRWLDRIGPDRVADDLELALLTAWLEQLSGGGVRWSTFQLAARLGDARPCSVEQETELLTLQAYAHFCANDRLSAQHAAHRAVAQPQPSSPFVDGHRFAMLAVTTDPSDDAAAVAAAKTAAAAFSRVDGAFGAIAPHGMLSDFLRRTGEVVGALRTLEHYVRAFKLTHREFSAEAVVAHLAYAETLYWIDQIAEARAEFQLVVRREEISIAPPVIIEIARLHLQLCSAADGSSIDINAQSDAEEWRLLAPTLPPSMRSEVAFLRVVRDGIRRDHAAMNETLDAAGFDDADLEQLPAKAQLAVLHARIHVGSTDPVIATALRRLHTTIAPHVDFATHVRAGLLLAVHRASTGNHHAAQTLLAQLLPIVENARVHRYVLDCPALESCLTECGHPLAAGLALRMRTHGGGKHPFGLTQREHEVLRLAAEGLVAEEIAQRINMTRSSVYTYLSRIYRKMKVHSRTEALYLYRRIEI